MGNNAKMPGKDALHGSLAECYIKLNGNRYNFMQMHEFESKYEVKITEVPILGQTNMGHKATGGKGTWSGTAHFNQSIFRKVLYEYTRTGVMPNFEIQVTNEDPTSAVGRQTIIHKDCLFSELILAKFSSGDEVLDEKMSGTFESFDMPEAFAALEGM